MSTIIDTASSVEMHGNVFVRRGGGIHLLREAEAVRATGRRLVGGSHNWVPTGSTDVPPEWTMTVTGADPGLMDVDALALRPAGARSAVVDRGIADPPTLPSAPFPRPLGTPTTSPMRAPGSTPRVPVGALDIGAYEFGAPTTDLDGGTPPADAGLGEDGGVRDGGAGDGAGADDGGCGCRAAGAERPRGGGNAGSASIVLVAMALGGGTAARRRRARARRRPARARGRARRDAPDRAAERGRA
jgi:hypothetical protein